MSSTVVFDSVALVVVAGGVRGVSAVITATTTAAAAAERRFCLPVDRSRRSFALMLLWPLLRLPTILAVVARAAAAAVVGAAAVVLADFATAAAAAATTALVDVDAVALGSSRDRFSERLLERLLFVELVVLVDVRQVALRAPPSRLFWFRFVFVVAIQARQDLFFKRSSYATSPLYNATNSAKERCSASHVCARKGARAQKTHQNVTTRD